MESKVGIYFSDEVKFNSDLENFINQSATFALSSLMESVELGGAEQVDFDINLCSNKEIQELNNQWRGSNSPTNVLSFQNYSNMAEEPLPSYAHIGDIFISLEYAAQESLKSQVSFKNHILVLIVHGLAHLFGYDHQNEDEALTMQALEKKVLNHVLEKLSIDNAQLNPITNNFWTK